MNNGRHKYSLIAPVYRTVINGKQRPGAHSHVSGSCGNVSSAGEFIIWTEPSACRASSYWNPGFSRISVVPERKYRASAHKIGMRPNLLRREKKSKLK